MHDLPDRLVRRLVALEEARIVTDIFQVRRHPVDELVWILSQLHVILDVQKILFDDFTELVALRALSLSLFKELRATEQVDGNVGAGVLHLLQRLADPTLERLALKHV